MAKVYEADREMREKVDGRAGDGGRESADTRLLSTFCCFPFSLRLNALCLLRAYVFVSFLGHAPFVNSPTWLPLPLLLALLLAFLVYST